MLRNIFSKKFAIFIKKNSVVNSNFCRSFSHSTHFRQTQENTQTSLNYENLNEKVKKLRNVAIIAHVDHGKTTLVDQMLKQTGTLGETAKVVSMDNNDLEKERGITIFSKNTSGHADFGGEVERVLSMVDGVCLVVDATEGPMTQTKFVLSKALALNLNPLVIMNKVDRESSRVDHVDNDLLDLFMSLDASEQQMEYPIIYTSAKEGWAVKDLKNEKRESMIPLLDAIIEQVPPPLVDRDNKPFSMLVTQLESNKFLGKMYLGKIESGTLKINDTIHAIDTDGKIISKGKCTKIFLRRGFDHISINEAGAGDIVSIAGISDSFVNHTICNPSVKQPLKHVPIDEPTIAMQFFVNDSPLQGEEGKLLTSQVLRDRLLKETETNVALQVKISDDSFEVKGRGELQMGVLTETMRREGFELSITAPRVIYKDGGIDEATKKRIILEPIEEVTATVTHEMAGGVIQSLTKRKGEMISYGDDAGGTLAKLIFKIPTRGLLGYPAEFKNTTRGEGTLNHILLGYEPFKGLIEKERSGSIISTASGLTTSYALQAIEARGKLFVGPNTKVYPGMIIGEHSKEIDLEVNPVKAKQLTNVRASGKEDAVRLIPPIINPLEKLLSYIQEDEVIEVTPSNIRTRKKILDSTKRKSQSKKNYLDTITFE
ncbi:hypothetical protein HK099_005723 [Clydaea vesicula]|uniref:Tr-type G domain-containing protein n=1 Tax=Clydaea vesicula TaxID=447962 RepID=A0AAD5U9A4_9FUNG|nr:hypothetical protein HK099_005723 [Clydaea vesicula]